MLKTKSHITPFCILTTPTDMGETHHIPQDKHTKDHSGLVGFSLWESKYPQLISKFKQTSLKCSFGDRWSDPNHVPAIQPVKQYILLQPTTGKFTILIVLPAPHPQLLIIIPLFTKPQQQLRSKADAEVVRFGNAFFKHWLLQAAIKIQISDMCSVQHCQFWKFSPTSCNTWHS